MRRAIAEDKDKNLIDRKEKTRIHKELETLERNYMELVHKRKGDVQMKQNEVDNMVKDMTIMEEKKDKY